MRPAMVRGVDSTILLQQREGFAMLWFLLAFIFFINKANGLALLFLILGLLSSGSSSRRRR